MRPYRLITWAVSKSETMGVVLGQGQTVGPNSNCPSAGSLVVQVTVAKKGVRFLAETYEIFGAEGSGVLTVIGLVCAEWRPAES